MCLGPGRNIYAICDGYPIQKKSYYFNVFIPEFNITVTYMHLQVNTATVNLIDATRRTINPNYMEKNAPKTEIEKFIDCYEEICEGIEQGSIPTGAEAKFQELQDNRMEALREQMCQGIPKTPSQLEKILGDLEAIQTQTERLEQINSKTYQFRQNIARAAKGTEQFICGASFFVWGTNGGVYGLLRRPQAAERAVGWNRV